MAEIGKQFRREIKEVPYLCSGVALHTDARQRTVPSHCKTATNHFDAASAYQSNLDVGPVAYAYEYDETFMSLLQEVFASGNDAVTLNNSSPYTTNSVLFLHATSIMTVKTVQNVSCKQPLRVLFDSGTDVTLWNRRALPKGVQPEGRGAMRSTSIHGTKWMDQSVLCTELCFPKGWSCSMDHRLQGTK